MNSLISIGTRVRVPMGTKNVTGTVVEDLGLFGVMGRRLLRVIVPVEPDEPMILVIPENELELIELKSELEQQIHPDAVVNYLKHGGLTSILRSNLAGGKNQPRAWLCWDQLGHVTHTFIEERGVLGGDPVPYMAVEGKRIFEPKRDQVLAYLNSFGLERARAEEVIAAVGTYP